MTNNMIKWLELDAYINDNIKFDRKDFEIYFHSVCITILVTAGYYAYIKLITSEITNQMGSYLDLFS